MQIIHRGKYKSLTTLQRKWLKRRQAVEPLIGHTKSDHGMQRCWLKGALGDALHALSCGSQHSLAAKSHCGQDRQGREGVFVGLVGAGGRGAFGGK